MGITRDMSPPLLLRRTMRWRKAFCSRQSVTRSGSIDNSFGDPFTVHSPGSSKNSQRRCHYQIGHPFHGIVLPLSATATEKLDAVDTNSPNQLTSTANVL